MALPAPTSFVRELGLLFDDGTLAGLSDCQLLERFVRKREEAAFAALVARHGPMVLGVCRQIVVDHQLTEDAFQAVFLVLARKASSLRDPDRLATWLYGVAVRVARKARAHIARRHRREQGNIMEIILDGEARATTSATVPPADQTVLNCEENEVLHIEISRLPQVFRLPVVLCYFEGLTLDQAAVRLGCPAGTLRSRLARARDKLRRALTRRGFVFSGAVIAAAFDARSTVASVSPQLRDATTTTAIRFAARQTIVSTSSSLAREALRTMAIHKLRGALVTVVVLTGCAVGAGYLFHSFNMFAPSSETGPPHGLTVQRTPTEHRPAGAPPPPDAIGSAAGRMNVSGRVLDPQGKPVPNAKVNVTARRKLLYAVPGSEGCFPMLAGQGASNASGRFWLDAVRMSSSHHAQLAATALAPGYGVGWADLDPDEDEPSADIHLMPEQVIEGRLFDVNGQAVPGAAVSVSAIWRNPAPSVLAQGRSIENHWEGPLLWWGRVHDMPGWPKPVMTDADGRFKLHGIGRGVYARLGVFDRRFAPQTIEVATDALADVMTLKVALLPARTLSGRVTYADTGQPAAHATVHVGTTAGQGGVREGAVRELAGQADADGRFRVGVMSGDRINVWASAADGQPYRLASAGIDWPTSATERTVDLALSRGVVIRGKVVQEGGDQPVADAMVTFQPSAQKTARPAGGGWGLTKADGSFAFAVEPQAGHLSVQAADEDYLIQTIRDFQFNGGNRGRGVRLSAHAFLPHDAGPDAKNPEIRVALRRGATVKFRLIEPDGRPARDVQVYSRVVLGPTAASATRWWPPPWIEVARRGQFEIHGLDLETEVPVYFLQPERKLGATLRVSGKMAAQGPVTVRLDSCGQVAVRLVRSDGRPVAGQPPGVTVTMVVTPGPTAGSAEVRAGAFAADADVLGRLDPLNHGNGWGADAQGRVVWPALIPGASYRLLTRAAAREFIVGAGEALELGDVRIDKPPQ